MSCAGPAAGICALVLVSALAIDAGAQTRAGSSTPPSSIGDLRGPETASPEPRVKPYAPIATRLPKPFQDESFVAFRRQLAATAQRRVYAELAQQVARRGFFWDRDFDGRFDAEKTAVENLAVALQLERSEGSGWRRLAAFAAETSAAPLPARPGTVCAPGKPELDEAALDHLLELTGTEETDWAYPRMDGLPVHSAPGTAPGGRLGLYLVRALAREPAMASHPGWVRIATPAGRTGFVTAPSIVGLSAARLCYVRDVIGRWRIAGYIGRGE